MLIRRTFTMSLMAGAVAFTATAFGEPPAVPPLTSPTPVPVTHTVIPSPYVRVVPSESKPNAATVRLVTIGAMGFRTTPELAERIERLLDDTPNQAGGKNVTAAWVMTPREARLFEAFLQSERGNYDVLTEPRMVLPDGQTGFFQVGHPVEVISEMRVDSTNGGNRLTAKLETVGAGLTMRLTPRVAADGQSLRLGIETQYSSLAGPSVPRGLIVRSESAADVRQTSAVSPAPATSSSGSSSVEGRQVAEPSNIGFAVNIHSCQTTVALPFGSTTMVRLSGAPDASGAAVPKSEVFWVITPQKFMDQTGVGTHPPVPMDAPAK